MSLCGVDRLCRGPVHRDVSEFKILNLQLKFMMQLTSQCEPLITSFSKVNKTIPGLISSPDELVAVLSET